MPIRRALCQYGLTLCLFGCPNFLPNRGEGWRSVLLLLTLYFWLKCHPTKIFTACWAKGKHRVKCRITEDITRGNQVQSTLCGPPLVLHGPQAVSRAAVHMGRHCQS